MNFLFKLLLSISSISLLPIIFAIKSKYYLGECEFYRYIEYEAIISMLVELSLLGYFILPILLTILILWLVKKLDKDELKEQYIIEIEDYTSSFLPNYLGYFFVALSISDNDFFILLIICVILVIFVFLSQTKYFNPLFLIFGYKFYNIKMNTGLRILLISRMNYKKPSDIDKCNIYRINNFTFIQTNKEW